LLIKFTFSFKTVPEGCICNLSELMKLLMFFSEVPSDERLKEIIDYVHSLGGLVTVNGVTVLSGDIKWEHYLIILQERNF